MFSKLLADETTAEAAQGFSFAKLWEDIKNFFSSNVWNILLFIGVLIIGIIVIKIILNIIRKVLRKTKMEPIAQQFLRGVIKLLLYLILVLALLSIIGIQITGIITALSALLLAVGMALESNIANVANGIVIISTHMFKKGDYIVVNGVEGKIDDINFLFTTMITNDNKRITLPNSTIVNNSVTNLGAYEKRRVDFTFSVAYESDVEVVKKLVTDVMTSDGRVYLDPAPFCRLKSLNDSSIDFFANCWCDAEDYWDVYYYVIENVYNELKRKKISVPYPQMEIRQRTDNVKMPVQGKGLPERVEKERHEVKKLDLETMSFKDLIKHKNKKDKKDKTQKMIEKENKRAEKKSKKAKAVTTEEPQVKEEPKSIVVKTEEIKEKKTSNKKKK